MIVVSVSDQESRGQPRVHLSFDMNYNNRFHIDKQTLFGHPQICLEAHMSRWLPADCPAYPAKLIWKNIHGRRMFYPKEQSVNKRETIKVL